MVKFVEEHRSSLILAGIGIASAIGVYYIYNKTRTGKVLTPLHMK